MDLLLGASYPPPTQPAPKSKSMILEELKKVSSNTAVLAS